MQQFSRGGVLTPGAVSLELVCSYSLMPSLCSAQHCLSGTRSLVRNVCVPEHVLATNLKRHAGQTRNMTSYCIARQLPKKI